VSSFHLFSKHVQASKKSSEKLIDYEKLYLVSFSVKASDFDCKCDYQEYSAQRRIMMEALKI
jgi:hypothetical protein